MSSEISLLLYIVVFIGAFLFTKRYEDTGNNIYLYIAGGILIVLSGIRYFVGTDFENYMYAYDIITPLDFANMLNTEYEVGFFVVVKMASFLGNVQYLFVLFAALTVYFLIKVIKDHKNYASLIMFVYLFSYFTGTFNIIRQGLSVIMVCYGFKYLINRSFIKYSFMVLLASLFHTTAIIMLPIYFAVQDVNKKITKKQIFIIFLAIVAILNFNTIFSILTSISIFSDYDTYSQAIDSTNLSFILSLIMLIVYLSNAKVLISEDKKNKVYLILYIFSVIISFSGYISPFLKRVAMYFSIVDIFIIATLLKSENVKNKDLIKIFLVTYVIGEFILSTYILGQAEVLPYRTIFNEITY